MNLLRARAQVSYAEPTTTAEELVDEIESIGFDASILAGFRVSVSVVVVVLCFFCVGGGGGGKVPTIQVRDKSIQKPTDYTSCMCL